MSSPAPAAPALPLPKSLGRPGPPERLRSPEPLTQEEPDRVTILPIRDPEVWAMYKQLEAMQWIASEVDLTRDRHDWDALSPGDRAFYEYPFGMFSTGDEIVIANLGDNLLREIKRSECRYFFGMQCANEQVHSESYAQQIHTLFDGPDRERVLGAASTMPAIARMSEWARRWMDPAQPLGIRLAGWACFEGVLFQGQFLVLQLLKVRNVLPGVTQLNEYISRDEALHCAAACFLLRKRILHRPPQEQFHAVVREAVALHDEFMGAAILAAKRAEGVPDDGPCPVLHVSEQKLRQYIRFTADFVCVQAGYGKAFGVDNSYPEASRLSLNSVGKTNFFEHSGTQYSMRINTLLAADPARCARLKFCTPVQ